MADLRDLDADRRLCTSEIVLPPAGDNQVTLIDFGNQALTGWLAALDEIDRLKRFLVWRNPITGKWSARIDCHTSSGAYETEADAWAAARKAANSDT